MCTMQTAEYVFTCLFAGLNLNTFAFTLTVMNLTNALVVGDLFIVGVDIAARGSKLFPIPILTLHERYS